MSAEPVAPQVIRTRIDLSKATPEERLERKKMQKKEHYLRVIKPARDRLMRIKPAFEALRDLVFAAAFIYAMPCDQMAELQLIDETAAANTIEDYDDDMVKRKQIKNIIYVTLYNRVAANILCDYKLDALRRGKGEIATMLAAVQTDEEIKELKNMITDFVKTADAAWVDSIMPGTLIATLSP